MLQEGLQLKEEMTVDTAHCSTVPRCSQHNYSGTQKVAYIHASMGSAWCDRYPESPQ